MQIISAKYLLTMDSPPISDGGIIVEEGKIVAVGPKSDLLSQYKVEQTENYPDHVLMPGLVNAHVHLDMGAHRNFPFDPVRNLLPEVNFVDWLISCIDYKKKARQESLREALEEGIAQSIEAGTTCVGDMGSFEGIFQLLQSAGLRGVVFPEVINYDKWLTQDLYESALATVEKYQEAGFPLLKVGLAPYSPYTLSRNILKVMSTYCAGTKTPLMLHTAESFSEMEFFYNSSGDIASRFFPRVGWGDQLPPAFHKTPIAYLDEIQFLKPGPILVGCVQATPDDLLRIAKAQAKVVLTPRANHYLQVGEPPIEKMAASQVPLALGTDGLSSTNTLSMWDEMRFVHEQIIKGKNSSLTALDLLRMATVNAARALGLENQIGTLSSGKRADYLAVKIDNNVTIENISSHLVQNTKSYRVHKVVVDGRVLKNII